MHDFLKTKQCRRVPFTCHLVKTNGQDADTVDEIDGFAIFITLLLAFSCSYVICSTGVNKYLQLNTA